mgnify:FL=1
MTYQAPRELLDQLKRDEGLRLTVYADTLGHPTIGYGRALDTKGISRAEAEMLLTHDILDAAAEVETRFAWAGIEAFGEARRGVLINMTFNLGINGLLGFVRMLDAAESGDYDRAAAEMMDSTWATQVGPRAHRLARQMQTGAGQ